MRPPQLPLRRLAWSQGREQESMEQDDKVQGRERDAELRFLRSIVENANDAILVTEATPSTSPVPG